MDTVCCAVCLLINFSCLGYILASLCGEITGGQQRRPRYLHFFRRILNMALNALHSQHVQADLPKARHSIPPPFQLKKKNTPCRYKSSASSITFSFLFPSLAQICNLLFIFFFLMFNWPRLRAPY